MPDMVKDKHSSLVYFLKSESCFCFDVFFISELVYSEPLVKQMSEKVLFKIERTWSKPLILVSNE